MNSRILTRMKAIAMFATLALPVQLAAQHTRYKLIDLGTLGGRNSYQITPAQSLNNRSEVIAFADTAVPDPNGQNGITDGLVSHAILGKQGVVTDLGTPAGVDSTVNASVPTWISETGLVAGMSENGLIDPLTGFPQVRAVLWNGGSGINLGTLGGNSSQAFGVNSRVQVVGVALNATPDDFSQFMNFLPAATQARGFLWQNGSMHDLGTLGGPDANALVINERGQVAGFSFTDSSPNATTGMPTVHPFLWENGRMLDLGSLGGTLALPGPLAAPGGGVLNSRGQVVGTSTLAGDINRHAFLWEGGVMKDLGTLGGNNSEAFFISEAGDVVGRHDISLLNTIHHAFLWKNGVMTDLGALDPCLNSTATSVNSNGQVVGDTGKCPDGGGGHPFLSEQGQPMVDLQNLALPGSDLTVIDAAFINDRGEIAGLGALPNGDLRAVLLVPASAAEIAAASALTVSRPPATAAERLANTEADAPASNRNRTLSPFRRLRPEP
jgi:probable HAF family extracellular repeat protein